MLKGQSLDTTYMYRELFRRQQSACRLIRVRGENYYSLRQSLIGHSSKSIALQDSSCRADILVISPLQAAVAIPIQLEYCAVPNARVCGLGAKMVGQLQGGHGAV